TNEQLVVAETISIPKRNAILKKQKRYRDVLSDVPIIPAVLKGPYTGCGFQFLAELTDIHNGNRSIQVKRGKYRHNHPNYQM
ncbi:hypothetical protein PHMEG_00020402, partial [Phytophthora megakarya]